MVSWKTLKYRADGRDFEFAVGTGKTTHVMGELGNKRVIGVADEAQRRCIALDDNVDEAHIEYVDCAKDMIVYPQGNVKEFAIVLGSKDLQTINKRTKLSSGSLVLSRDSIPYGTEFEGDLTRWFRKEDLVINRELTFDEYMDHEVWGTLLHDPKIEGMPEEIATHPQFKEHYGRQMWSNLEKDVRNDKAMGVYILTSTFKNFTGGRLFCLGGTDDIGSVVGDYCGSLDDVDGRLLGVAPKAQATLRWVPKDQLETFLRQSFAYVPEILQENFRRFVSQYEIKKK